MTMERRESKAELDAMKKSVMKREFAFRAVLGLAVAFCVFVVCAPHAAAQGCAMCYQNAAASGAQGREALRQGILILLFPVLSLFVGIFVLIFRRRNVSR
jgi:hypothetical protein